VLSIWLVVEVITAWITDSQIRNALRLSISDGTFVILREASESDIARHKGLAELMRVELLYLFDRGLHVEADIVHLQGYSLEIIKVMYPGLTFEQKVNIWAEVFALSFAYSARTQALTEQSYSTGFRES